ncbi:MAG: hypothetical protein ABS39_00925 [Acidovorax sp. SCN 65-28]|uniref:sensor domain-containing diguanylate cyclase n=1 Tax=Acidovorax sp. TaxID=1872122 RepID=UPI0008686C27|nr:GGDEF domain-containing protein [Acidovorax sp.]MBN9626317.1 GGDEF domain-containing protein [Acidovorax sp.]ODS80003.1 MAG: hypothetical protein ABS39_00925 [Acidovorax sp. SCN 65-28]
MTSDSTPDDALIAFLQGVSVQSQCRLAVALWQRAPDEVVPLCSVPTIALTHTPVWRWRLPVSPKTGTHAVQRLSRKELPSLVTAGLPFSPGLALYVDCSAFGRMAGGGFVLIWDEATALADGSADADLVGGEATVQWLRPVYAQLVDARQWEEQNAESAAQFHHVFDSVPQGIVVLSARHPQAQINAAAAALLGLSAGWVSAEVLAQAMRATRERCDNASELEQAYAPLQSDLDAELVVRWFLDDCVWRVDTHPILQSGHKGRVWLFHDITSQVRLERFLRMEANHDSLTGLFNRRAFFDRAQVAFQLPSPCPSDGHRLALVMLDIDHFKAVNDRYGHPAGDMVLKEVARRAKSVLRDGDVLARYGGEEFIVLLNVISSDTARVAAERLRTVMDTEPVQVGDRAITVSVSVGLALRSSGSETLLQTIERADANLYRAKRQGRNRVVDDAD